MLPLNGKQLTARLVSRTRHFQHKFYTVNGFNLVKSIEQFARRTLLTANSLWNVKNYQDGDCIDDEPMCIFVLFDQAKSLPYARSYLLVCVCECGGRAWTRSFEQKRAHAHTNVKHIVTSPRADGCHTASQTPYTIHTCCDRILCSIAARISRDYSVTLLLASSTKNIRKITKRNHLWRHFM